MVNKAKKIIIIIGHLNTSGSDYFHLKQLFLLLIIIIHYITSICHPNRDENKNKKKINDHYQQLFQVYFYHYMNLFQCFSVVVLNLSRIFIIINSVYEWIEKWMTIVVSYENDTCKKKKNPSTRTHNVNWNPITIFFWWWCCVRVTIITINSND